MQHDGGDFNQAASNGLRDLERSRSDLPDESATPMVELGVLRGIVNGLPLAALLWGIIILIGWALS
uniref:hypothetical protein n=1 Tax=uncultured Sphingomonas sp. TaxID=158754 RepID=UPI0035CC57B9